MLPTICKVVYIINPKVGKRDYIIASAANRIIVNTYNATQLFFSTHRDKINVVFYMMVIHCLNL